MPLVLSDNLNSPNPFELLSSLSDPNTELDNEFPELAVELIVEMGKTVVFTTCPNGEYDVVEGELKNAETLNYIEKVIPPFEYEEKYINGDVIQVGDLQTGIAFQALEFTPEKGMQVSFDNQTFNIMKVSPIYSGQRIALFLLQLRK